MGSPLFSTITIRVQDGYQIQIQGVGASDSSPYVQSLKLNGQLYNKPWIPFDALQGGATLQFALGKTPNQTWGS